MRNWSWGGRSFPWPSERVARPQLLGMPWKWRKSLSPLLHSATKVPHPLRATTLPGPRVDHQALSQQQKVPLWKWSPTSSSHTDGRYAGSAPSLGLPQNDHPEVTALTWEPKGPPRQPPLRGAQRRSEEAQRGGERGGRGGPRDSLPQGEQVSLGCSPKSRTLSPSLHDATERFGKRKDALTSAEVGFPKWSRSGAGQGGIWLPGPCRRGMLVLLFLLDPDC